jgi:hypothetical protein
LKAGMAYTLNLVRNQWASAESATGTTVLRDGLGPAL